MRLDEKSLLFDVRESCTLIAQFTARKTYADYAADAALRSAIERQFIVAGEALNRLGRCPRAGFFRQLGNRDQPSGHLVH